jgi:Transcription factor WhiB
VSAELAAPDPGPWWTTAACIGRTSLFFAADEFCQRLACAVCRRCEVRQECLDDALAIETPGERYGVAGGATAAQREALGLARGHPKSAGHGVYVAEPTLRGEHSV